MTRRCTATLNAFSTTEDHWIIGGIKWIEAEMRLRERSWRTGVKCDRRGVSKFASIDFKIGGNYSKKLAEIIDNWAEKRDERGRSRRLSFILKLF